MRITNIYFILYNARVCVCGGGRGVEYRSLQLQFNCEDIALKSNEEITFISNFCDSPET